MLCVVYIPVMYVLNMRTFVVSFGIQPIELGDYEIKNILALIYSPPKQHGKDSHVLAAMTTGIKMAQTSPRC